MIDRSMSMSGCSSFWTLAPYSSRQELHSRLKAIGWEVFAPAQRNPSACLKDALEKVFRNPRVLVRPNHDRNGWCVVNESREPGMNRYTQELHAVVDDNHQVTYDQPHHEAVSGVSAAYRDYLGLLPAATVGGAMVKILKAMNAVTLRDSGGVYWLSGVDEWKRVAEAVEGSARGGKSNVYLMRTAMDAEAAKAIRDSLAAEVLKEASLLHADISSGELGEKALENRVETCKALHTKVREYESILSTGLDHLHNAVAQVEKAMGKGSILMAVA